VAVAVIIRSYRLEAGEDKITVAHGARPVQLAGEPRDSGLRQKLCIGGVPTTAVHGWAPPSRGPL